VGIRNGILEKVDQMVQFRKNNGFHGNQGMGMKSRCWINTISLEGINLVIVFYVSLHI